MIIYEYVFCFIESFIILGRFFFIEGIYCWMGEIFYLVWLFFKIIYVVGDIIGREILWECLVKEDIGGGEFC